MLAKKKNYSDYEVEIDGSPKPVLRHKRDAKGIFVKPSHLLMFWSFTAGMMILLFVVGYHTGKVNGRKTLLDEVSTNSSRLPIVSTMAKGQTEDILSLVKAKTAKSNSVVNSVKKEQKFDFANSSILPSMELSPGWYLQIAATGSLEKANKIKKSIDAKKQNASIQRITVRKRNFFKILAGPYNSKSLAESKSKLVKVNKVDPFIVEIK